jgi:regulatory protein
MGNYEVFLNSALRFLAFRPRSEKEVRDNLKKKNVPQEVVEQIITRLKDNKFLNDEEFARWWIDQSLRIRHRSKRVIEIELKQKGVERDIIEQAISSFKFLVFNDSQGGLSDLETARALVQKKIARYKHLPKQEIYQKLGALLGRRGFDWETIKRSIDYVHGAERS